MPALTRDGCRARKPEAQRCSQWKRGGEAGRHLGERVKREGQTTSGTSSTGIFRRHHQNDLVSSCWTCGRTLGSKLSMAAAQALPILRCYRPEKQVIFRRSAGR